VRAAQAINELQLGGGTAIGEAIYASLGSIAADPQPSGTEGSPARIVLMSDGATNAGRPDDLAAQAAATAHVPITTIAYGTDTGQVTVRGRTIDVPVDSEALRQIASATGGRFFQAASASQLRQVYDTIRTGVSFRTEHREITSWFIGIGIALLVAAAAGSLTWSPRLP
jgi:Ca-activated chloride channel family protein